MKIFVTARPRAKENRVEKLGETHFKVFVKAAPKEGKANRAVIEVLSAHFGLPKSRFSIVRGETSKTKVVELS